LDTQLARRKRRVAFYALAGFLVLVVVGVRVGAQMRFDRGQNVAPVFEGWERNPDGTFNMVFGYLNRNYQEIPQVPLGPNNSFEPGPADRGQPTRFYTRRQQFVFKVQVPADWGEKDLIWTLTSNGRTDKAFGSLWPSWEIDDGVIKANRGMGANGAPNDNQRPSISLPSGTDLTVSLPDTLTLTAFVSDDGIPGPRLRRDEASDNDDPLRAADRRRRLTRRHPVNQAIVNARIAGETGLAVTWVHYRGPGTVTFDPMGIPVQGGRSGEVVTVVSFTEAGTHVLRAYADDSINTTPIDVSVAVR